MGLSASQGRMLLLTARKSDLEFRAQQISQKRLLLSQQLEEIALEYENATSNRQMKIFLYSNTQDGVENENNTRTTNLTYSALISGTLGLSSDETGIQLGDYMSKPEFTSTTAYRLVDATGAIVVADVSEIPTSYTDKKTSEAATTANNGVYTQTINEYSCDMPSNWDASKAGDYVDYATSQTTNLYAKIPNDKIAADTSNNTLENLAYFLTNTSTGKGASTSGIEFDSSQGIMKFNVNGKNYYFNAADGTQVTLGSGDFTKFTKDTTISLLEADESVPTSSYTFTSTSTSDGELEPGLDGKYRVTINGVERTYVVDPGLKAGVTDINASKTSPNYLQDCLRNGKYLLEQGSKSEDLGKYQWKSISWDTTANISDGYYTEDDDKAKAKYDRLQTQIQNQDKKLEIELDNIETQRSAVTTEQESVKKVIQENIEGSFNAFA